jgi:hypothetical protein
VPSFDVGEAPRRSTSSLARMYTCPHCATASISFWRKGMSSLLFPAKCPACHAESVPSGWNAMIAAIYAELLLWGSIIFAVAVQSIWGLLLMPIGLIALSLILGRLFPLAPVDTALTRSRRVAKRYFWIALAVLAAFLILTR